MDQEIRDQLANAAAAQIWNVYLGSEDCTPVKFQKISRLISELVRRAVIEERCRLLRPSKN
jgi:hypothetical protein